ASRVSSCGGTSRSFSDYLRMAIRTDQPDVKNVRLVKDTCSRAGAPGFDMRYGWIRHALRMGSRNRSSRSDSAHCRGHFCFLIESSIPLEPSHANALTPETQ